MLNIPHFSKQTMPELETEIGRRGEYQRHMLAIRGAFLAGATGAATIAARAESVDALVKGLWADAIAASPLLAQNVALVAIGGYGRSELFPYSDVDLLFVLDGKLQETDVKPSIRKLSQELWDAGIRFSPQTRRRSECEHFSSENVEFAISMLDHRLLAGDSAVYDRLVKIGLPRLLEKDGKEITALLVEVTAERHRKYGNTLFHLEPNIKDCPGGLRDVHVCAWLERLAVRQNGTSSVPIESWAAADAAEFQQAREFLFVVRCFLHYRHERDDNTLDWQAQDAAAHTSIGLQARGANVEPPDAAYWMRLYFRHARSVQRRLNQMVASVPPPSSPGGLLRSVATRVRRTPTPAPHPHGFYLENGRAGLSSAAAAMGDPAHDSEVVLQLFAAMSRTGAALDRASEERLSNALPLISAHLEEGPALWRHLREILIGRYAGRTLRVMHALGILELLIPEFHGIDALVIRDAYHRYTVDEHTMVVIDTIHGLEIALEQEPSGPMGEWPARFGAILRDVQHPELLYLAALLHDTGKGRNTPDHSLESARMAEHLLKRLELDAYESELVLGLIRNHLDMSSALRRDIFDRETVRTFAGRVQTPEALRMITLFTYADIQGVHPDALTPWKAENMWRLFLATASTLDRNVDDDRVGARVGRELVRRVSTLVPDPAQRGDVEAFLAGFPERYLRTRTPEQVRTHFELTRRFPRDPVQIEFRYTPQFSEITLLTRDRSFLFADMAGALAAWGMNIVTADAFSNEQGIVVDTFRFTDSFRTLEMNASEHDRFVASVHDVMTGVVKLEKLLSGRRHTRRPPPKVAVESRVQFDDNASSHSTLLEVIAQDVPGLLRAISITLGRHLCNIEVALIDTEGETAIDVFYLTRNGAKLESSEQEQLRHTLLSAITENLAS